MNSKGTPLWKSLWLGLKEFLRRATKIEHLLTIVTLFVAALLGVRSIVNIESDRI